MHKNWYINFFSENLRTFKWADIFECVWTENHATVQTKMSEYFQLVPVKNGDAAIGWWGAYGDCNMAIKRTICHFPRHLAILQKNIQKIKYIDSNLAKCKNSPLNGNQHTQKYNCCLEHAYMLKQCGLNLDDINHFCWYFNALDMISRSKSENVKEKWTNKISTIPQHKKVLFQELNANICKLMGINSDNNDIILSKVQEIMIDESVNDNTIDDLRSCRKGQNIAKPKFGQSSGTLCVMNCAGAILFLQEVPVRETPTFVIHQLFQSFTNSTNLIEYYQRLEFLGIFMCFILFFFSYCAIQVLFSNVT